MSKLFFYHSFPRYKDEKLAFDVLHSILKMGLLLTAEKRMLPKSGRLKSAPLVQDRLCFTAIEPKYLRAHTKQFGTFSLEYEGSVILSFGAQPVVYLAGKLADGRLLDTAGIDLVRHALEAREVLRRLWRLSDKSTKLGKMARRIKQRIYPYGEPFQRCYFSVQALLNLFYPTDRKHKTPPLHVFRQREWRIVPNLSHRNKWLYPFLGEAEKNFLMEINPKFFRVRVGRKTRLTRCMRFPQVGRTNVLESARRLIVPDRHLARVQKIVTESGVRLRVVPLSALPSEGLPISGIRKKGRS